MSAGDGDRRRAQPVELHCPCQLTADVPGGKDALCRLRPERIRRDGAVSESDDENGSLFRQQCGQLPADARGIVFEVVLVVRQGRQLNGDVFADRPLQLGGGFFVGDVDAGNARFAVERGGERYAVLRCGYAGGFDGEVGAQVDGLSLRFGIKWRFWRICKKSICKKIGFIPKKQLIFFGKDGMISNA